MEKLYCFMLLYYWTICFLFNLSFYAVAKSFFATAYHFFKNSKSVPFKETVSLNGTPWPLKKKGQNDQERKIFLVILPHGLIKEISNVTYKKKKSGKKIAKRSNNTICPKSVPFMAPLPYNRTKKDHQIFFFRSEIPRKEKNVQLKLTQGTSNFVFKNKDFARMRLY